VAARTRFEYRVVTITVDRAQADGVDLAALDDLGAEGWEAVGISPATASGRGLHVETSTYVVLLKRTRSGR
jgi:hypothetical protein